MMYLPSEFAPQEMVQLTWPHRETDWADVYEEVTECYSQMAREISSREPLLIVAQNPDEVREELTRRSIDQRNIRLHECKTNDTWARDHGFISCIDGGQRLLMDFQFNGWGLKFAANKDNQINRSLKESGMIEGEYVDCRDFVLEGGSIESDGKGSLLTTTSCLLADNRNNLKGKQEVESKLLGIFNAKRVLWLDHSWLAGDDTDGHIDTVARFCSEDTIAYVRCTDSDDEHFEELSSMEAELKAMRTLEGKPYRLVALPMADAIYDGEERLPATYANFLIMNTAVLVPTYGQKENDTAALEQLCQAFPGRDIVGIDCQVLIKQHGSLHCCTMQYPLI